MKSTLPILLLVYLLTGPVSAQEEDVGDFDDFDELYMGELLNMLLNRIEFNPMIVSDAQGLPDLDNSSATYDNVGEDMNIIGSELAVRYTPNSKLSFLFS